MLCIACATHVQAVCRTPSCVASGGGPIWSATLRLPCMACSRLAWLLRLLALQLQTAQDTCCEGSCTSEAVGGGADRTPLGAHGRQGGERRASTRRAPRCTAAQSGFHPGSASTTAQASTSRQPAGSHRPFQQDASAAALHTERSIQQGGVLLAPTRQLSVEQARPGAKHACERQVARGVQASDTIQWQRTVLHRLQSSCRPTSMGYTSTLMSMSRSISYRSLRHRKRDTDNSTVCLTDRLYRAC